MKVRWWTLPNMVPGDYSVYTDAFVRWGREYTRLRSPAIRPATVLADQSTPIRKVVDGEERYPFVMRPAYLHGSIRLADPYVVANPGASSTLQRLFFEADHDRNQDGIPNYMALLGRLSTVLYATAAGAAGVSATAFPGQFDTTTRELASNYEQVLPSPYDQPLTWTQAYLRLTFWSQGERFVTRPGEYDPALYRYGNLDLQQKQRSANLMPGASFRVDHEYCFNEVQVEYSAMGTRFYNPTVQVSGSFQGTDWRRLPADYAVRGKLYVIPAAVGIPATEAAQYAQPRGSINFTLPQGEYTLTPGATLVNENGGTNDATFQPLQFTLGCGQRLKLVPPLAVVVDAQPPCTQGDAVTVTGKVKSSPAVVDRVWYQLGDGPEVTLCTHCGIDPTFSFPVELRSCENTVKVYAYTEGLSEPATGFQKLVWDDPSDGPSCAGSTCVNRPPVARCRNPQVAANEACQGTASVDDGSYDPEDGQVQCVQTPDGPYTMGRQRVTLTCTDSLGATSACEATVTVRDETPPQVVCPEVAVLECREGGARASYAPVAHDKCGTVSTACTPASGSVYALGTTPVTCTATDGAGNRAQCTFGVTVVDTQPPALTCPAPVNAECTGNGSATVVPGSASAQDVCTAAPVTGPGEATWPLGTHPVTYSATDASGNTATCTSSLTVVDTQPPALACPAPVIAECTGNGGADVVPPMATATDVCTPAQVEGPTATRYPLGTTPVTYTAADASGNTATCTSSVTVVDTQPPVVKVGEPVRLWAPNHGYHTLRLADCGIVVEDACGGTLTEGQVRTTLDCVSSDEPEDGAGDGHTQPDIVLVDDTTVKLRAERQGTGDGRVYRLHFTVRDATGHAVPGVCIAVVEHDQGGASPMDSGEAYRVCRE